VTVLTVNAGSHQISIPPREMVVDDLVLLRPGEEVPVGGEVCETDGIEVDESQLTGESEPVEEGPGDELRPGTLWRRAAARSRRPGCVDQRLRPLPRGDRPRTRPSPRYKAVRLQRPPRVSAGGMADSGLRRR
jgi:magnesium-transporting ATPase (P-type)